MKTTRKARPAGNRKSRSRPIRDNLLRNLKAAREYLNSLREFENAGYSCGYSIRRAVDEVEKLTRLTS
jgi:hypothetical protein